MPVRGLVTGRLLPLMAATVGPERTNVLGHMRAAEYVALFDDAFLAFIASTGLTGADLRHGATSPFLLDLHATYLREAKAGCRVAIAAQALDADPRRARLILLMDDAEAGTRLATCELAILNFDMATRKPAPWAPDQMRVWSELLAAHASLSPPPEAGRAIGPLTRGAGA